MGISSGEGAPEHTRRAVAVALMDVPPRPIGHARVNLAPGVVAVNY